MGHVLHAAAAKFTGSGGAIVALCPEGEAQEFGLKAACQREGFVCVPVQVDYSPKLANSHSCIARLCLQMCLT